MKIAVTTLTAVLLAILIVGIVVLAALHDQIPTILSGLVAAIAGGHLALSTPAPTSPQTVPTVTVPGVAS